MSQIDNIEGVGSFRGISFKIEERFERRGICKKRGFGIQPAIDNLIKKYLTAIAGILRQSDYHFEPNLRKTFNRGFTSYFLHGRTPDIASSTLPKPWESMLAMSRRSETIRSTLPARHHSAMVTACALSLTARTGRF
jgi:hypothetical protein